MTAKTASRMSTLNPNAPLFLPASYLAAEDFSPEWWHLVQTCPAFRDYWLRERFDEMEGETVSPKPADDDVDDLEFEDLLELELQDDEFTKDVDQPTVEEGNGVVSDFDKNALTAFAGLNINDLRAQQQRIWREPVKYHDKVTNRGPRSPRKGGNNQFRIQQPRP